MNISRVSKSRARRVTWVLGAGVMVMIAVHLLQGAGVAKYSLTYESYIKKHAAEYSVDPFMVAAVIHIESAGNPNAVSGAGAVGLMQIMPVSGNWIAGMIGTSFDPSDLRDPDTNIQLGTWYLKFLLKMFPSEATAIAAYNAGQGRVAKWLKDPQYSKNGKDLINIPYQETEDYVSRFKSAYRQYKQIYSSRF